MVQHLAVSHVYLVDTQAERLAVMPRAMGMTSQAVLSAITAVIAVTKNAIAAMAQAAKQMLHARLAVCVLPVPAQQTAVHRTYALAEPAPCAQTWARAAQTRLIVVRDSALTLETA